MNNIKKIIAITTTAITLAWMSGISSVVPAVTTQAATGDSGLTVEQLTEAFNKMSNEELKAVLISLFTSKQDLADQVAQLIGNTSENSTSTYEGIPADFTEFTKVMRIGSKNDQVKYMQIILRSEVGEDVVGKADGVFGKKTDAAVKAFQKANDLVADGIVGPKTNAVLNAKLAASRTQQNNDNQQAQQTPPAGCACTDWVNDACENGKMKQTRTCTPEEGAEEGVCDNAVTSQSVDDDSCVVATEGLTIKLLGPASTNVAIGSPSEFLKVNLLASKDTNISSIKVTAGGLGTVTAIDDVVIYQDGVRRGNVKNINSSGYASFNFSDPIELKAGIASELLIKATIASGSSATTYSLNIEEIVSNADSVNGLPITGNLMSGSAATLGTLTFTAGSTPADVNLGDKNVTIANFKVSNNNVEKIQINSISLKRDTSLSSICKDSDLENLELWYGGNKVATAEGFVDKYVTFNFGTPVVIDKNYSNRVFTVKADVVGGAGYDIKLKLDSTADVFATGLSKHYPSTIAGSYDGTAIDINAGTVTIEKENAENDKIRSGAQTDVVFGKFKVTANSGTEVEMTTLKLTIVGVNDNSTDTAFTYIENVEVYDETTGLAYDLSYVSGSASATKVYANTDMGLIMQSGEEHVLDVRADTTSSASNQEYTISIASVSNHDVVLKETADETSITDITPNSVSLKKVTVQAPAITFSTNALSSSYNAVVGAEDITLLDFNVKANETSSVKITELKFADTVSGTTVTSGVVSVFKLFVYGSDTPVKTVSASNLSNEEITFSDLALEIPANTTARYTLTTSLVDDSDNNGKSIKYRISGYTAEDADPQYGGASVYDSTNDNVSTNGIIASGEVGHSALTSNRTVAINSTGILYVKMDNTDTNTNTDSYIVAGNEAPYLAAIKLRADNEDIKIEDLAVNATSTSGSNVGNIYSSLSLVDEDGNVIATTNNVATTTTFEDINYIVGSSSKVLYLRGETYQIGKNYAGSVNTGDIQWKAQDIVAEGNSSGTSLSADGTSSNNGSAEAGEIAYYTSTAYDDAYDYTGLSNSTAVLASRIADVDLVSSYGGESLDSSIMTTGTYTAAIIKVSVADTDNTLATGDTLKHLIGQIKVKLSYNASTTIGSVTLEKINGGGTALTGTQSGSNGTKYVIFDTSDSSFGVDDEIASGETVYYVVKVAITGLESGSTNNDWIQIDLDKLNGTDGDADANGANFKWKDGSDASYKYPLRIKGKTKVDGTKISESI